MSTLSLPTALGDAANKVLLTSYIESLATWRSFASIKSANNFKDHTGIRPSHTAGNALKNVVSLEVEPRLSNADRFSGTSTKACCLFAGPQDMPLVFAFLQGRQEPVVEFCGFDADPNVLAATWRVYYDYGCAFGDFRAAYKAKGE